MDWLLLLIGMTNQGGWTLQQIPFQSKELCETARLRIEDKVKHEKGTSFNVLCVKTQGTYGSFRKGGG
jgi:hypothetical protein